MGSPKTGIYIILGEINLVVTAMRRSSRWSSHSHQDDDQDPLLSSFSQLKDVLNNISDLDELEPNTFLSPFLEVIRSEDTTGPITGLALTSINKFLSYGLVCPGSESTAAAIENVADAVTHARFVGTDPGSDEVVLMKILHVLRTLLLTPAGAQLTNESVCEIMQSCFRICFETLLSDLLRKSAEHTLMDMVQLLFSRLPQFKEDPKWTANMKKLKMRAGGVDPSRVSKKKRSPKPKPKRSQHVPPTPEEPQPLPSDLETRRPSSQSETPTTSQDPYIADIAIATTPVAPGHSVIDITKSFQERSDKEDAESKQREGKLENGTAAEGEVREEAPDEQHISQSARESSTRETTGGQPPAPDPGGHVVLEIPETEDNLKKSSSETELSSEVDQVSCPSEVGDDTESIHSAADHSDSAHEEYISSRGVRFTPQQHVRDGSGPLIPYGLPCVRELFRFLISLTNPLDRHNTDAMVHMGLSLLTVALESGADYVGSFNSLLYLVKDEMCKSLFMLIQSERLSLFAAAIRVCFLLFEALRSHLKFQLEMYLTKLSEIIVSEGPKVSYEMREIALESVVQLWRIPGLVTELFINYDCDLYCSNVFEDLTKLLSKNAFPVAGLFTTHLLSLDALLTVVDSIEQHCHSRVLNSTKLANEGEGKGNDGAPIRPQGETKWDSYVSSSDQPEPGRDGKAIQVPPTTGYCMAQRLIHNKDSPDSNGKTGKLKDSRRGPQIKPNRQRVSSKIPTLDEIAALKHKKKLLQAGAEQFNTKPSKGIAFLQENGLLSTPLDPVEVAHFLKENPRIDKKMIGEYVSNRKNPQVIEAFVKSFNFEDCRVDEALRMYLETFRLPGEAPVISYLMEHFSEHWHKSNGEPFVNVDAAFTLAYAVIMLNVDQHNHNVRKQNIPMTVEQFKKNLKNTNGGLDFEDDMLEEIYTTIKGDEIVMPSEHVGLVRENYLWKVLLRRGSSKEGVFLHAPTGSFDHELFSINWGPTVAALSFVFDKSLDESIIGKSISGFRKCAMISAHYGVSDVFDNLVISLCKFTTLLSSVESPENIPVSFGNNVKAQLACRTVFGLAHRHGDILREGWKNILDCMLQLLRAKLLPKILTEVEDFVDPTGRISIVREESPSQRNESGVLSSFYNYFTMSEPANQKAPSPEDQEAIRLAHNCIKDCHLEQLVQESKFLREESLQELVKALIFASQGPEGHNNNSMGAAFDEDAAVFYLELLIKVVLQNRDRVGPVWQGVRDHLYSLVVNANEHTFLVERAIVGLLRLAIRLLRREEIASQVLTSLRILLLAKPAVIHAMTRQVSSGLHDLLRTNAANIHSTQDWCSLFILLEVVGAGCNPPPLRHVCPGIDVSETISDAGAQSDSEVGETVRSEEGPERGYTSDSELYDRESQQRHHRAPPAELEVKPVPGNGSWLLVNRDEVSPHPTKRSLLVNQYSIALNEELQTTDSKSLLKCCETLAFLVRDAAHVTPHNFESCVHTIRTFVEASLNGGRQKPSITKSASMRDKKPRKKRESRLKKSQSSPSHLANISDDDEGDNNTAALHSLSIQLLDLMHTLHTRAASIFSSWAAEGKTGTEEIDAGTSTLWAKCWCPLLQGIARLCCDARRQVRSQALTYLQRALLVHDLQTLSAMEWESCFNKVLFPLLTQLLGNINQDDPSGMEETRMRASTLLCKVFLQHLSPLLSLSTFTALWLTILEFMDKYMHADRSDLLCEAIPESLKNMLLVMDTAGIFQTVDGIESKLWKLTWDRIDTFLPNLKGELFKPRMADSNKAPAVAEVGQPAVTPEGAQPSATSTSPSSSPTPEAQVNGSTGTSTDSPEAVRPGSPLAVESPPTSTYILHPPLPSVASRSTTSPIASSCSPSQSVPILLNPDIMQGTAIPFISPQSTPERPTNIVNDNQ